VDESEATASIGEWTGFTPGQWQQTIDVRDFIQQNVTPYNGDEGFLVEPSERTRAVWNKLQPYFQEEIRKGVLDVDAKTPSSLTAHQPGYIDRDNEVIVGLQTDAPFRRAIMPYGGLRMVEAGLKAAGFEPDPIVHDIFTKYRKTHNEGVFDAYTPEIMASGAATSLRVCRTPMAGAGSSATIAEWRCTESTGCWQPNEPSGLCSTPNGRRTTSFANGRNWPNKCGLSLT